MPGINLSQSSQQSGSSQGASGEGFSLGGRLTASITLFCLAIVLWGGLSFYQSRLQSEIDGIVNTTAQKRTQFNGSDVDKVADFQLRLGLIQKNFSEKLYPSEMLTAIEQSILSGVVLTKYTYAGKSIAISGRADSLRTFAQQLVVFKSSKNYGTFSVGSTNRDKDGSVGFDITIALQ
jgi:hypothetical protein